MACPWLLCWRRWLSTAPARSMNGRSPPICGSRVTESLPSCPGARVDPRANHSAWKELLAEAGVRDARLHDVRHTAATMLLVLNVPTRAMMDVMGWSQASMAGRYQHVPNKLRRDIADRLGGLL